MNSADFWNDSNHSTIVIDKLNSLKKIVDKIEKIEKKIDSNLAMLNFNDEEMNEIINNDVEIIKTELNDLEIFALLNGPYDRFDAVLEIHPGAGGTESCDWANMLYRMYTRWCEKVVINTKLLMSKKVKKLVLKV